MKWAKRVMIEGGNTANPDDIQSWLEGRTQEEADRFAKDQTDQMRQQLSKYKICSFSSKIDNPVLWSHYADEHRGFCLIFSADNSFFGSAIKVEYQKEYPTLDVTEDKDYEILKNSALVKFDDWSYEKEYRLVSSEPNFQGALPVKNKKLIFPAEMLIGIVYGLKISDHDRNLLQGFCRQYQVKLQEKKAELSEDKYTLKIVTL